MMCVDFKNIREQFQLLNDFTDAYHWDIMDGHYVPNLALNLDMIKSLGDIIEKPIHAHLMVNKPQDFVEQLIDLEVAEITFHVDTVTRQFFRLKNLIRQAGIGVGLVLNPMDRVEQLEWAIDDLDSVTVMAVDPGFAAQPFISGMVKKVAVLKKLKDKNGYNYDIEVDGGVGPKTLDQLIEAGANRFVLGTSGLFHLADDLEECIKLAKEFIPFK